MELKSARRACDLCYRKRIKCDAQRPRCSNCQLYSTDCTHAAASRPKAKQKKLSMPTHGLRPQAPGQQAAPADDGPEAHGHSLQQGDQFKSVEETMIQSRLLTPLPLLVENGQDSALSSLSSPLLSPVPSASRGRRRMELPSEDIVRHVIDVYLSTCNSIMPLFHPQSLQRIVSNWYRQPASARQPSCWAAINVALALAQNHGSDHLNPLVAQAVDMAECLENAQSVLAEVVAGNLDLQTVQILLGLGILFMGAKAGDVRAPIIFVSTAVRLAQAMGMHRRDAYDGISPAEATQRRRVFWIAYILDRDVALRTRQAPIQHDDDMDLDMPPDDDEILVAVGINNVENVVDATFIKDTGTCGGTTTSFNLCRARVELAQIQGLIYDCVFSVRARCRDSGETANLALGIRQSIEQWKSRLPATLCVDALAYRINDESDSSFNISTLATAMCYMHSLIMMCLDQLCRVNSMELHWVEKVLSYARGLGDGSTTTSSASASAAPSLPPPPSPQGWDLLVGECREFLRLFHSIRSKHLTFINVQLCPFTSGLLCISINSFLNFEDANALTDQQLMADAAAVLRQMKEQTQSAAISKVLEVYEELNWHWTLLTAGLGV
ncbi:putative transcriptional regulatory protein [Colletotrichum orbiculare MAFF 240422]|uniref:Transcriptional regulatory protein n=1 Tax=Colletotrichum orbiculare (strain 104-T / ATCC 96160 / CBS 514.97 / LARS 414 / MAFF 240422) TaxID=1213857 RepID=A0A484G3I7_COLOR|nr:putative transcriptional regulatory protein [Colletotrichum orbiculare MAFF 240422]